MFRDLGVSGGSQADSSLAWLLAPHTVTITRLVIIIYTLISLSKTSKRFDLLSLSYLSFAGSRHIAYWVHIACWVQHFPQHHLSGSGIAQLEVYHCQEPGWGTPPVAKVMRKEARHTQRRDRASGVPLEILQHLPPKPESAYFLLCALTYTSDFTGGCPPLPLSEKRVSLQLQLTIPGCDSVSTYKLLWKSSSLPE